MHAQYQSSGPEVRLQELLMGSRMLLHAARPFGTSSGAGHRHRPLCNAWPSLLLASASRVYVRNAPQAVGHGHASLI